LHRFRSVYKTPKRKSGGRLFLDSLENKQFIRFKTKIFIFFSNPVLCREREREREREAGGWEFTQSESLHYEDANCGVTHQS
jgi:hypothetical protein